MPPLPFCPVRCKHLPWFLVPVLVSILSGVDRYNVFIRPLIPPPSEKLLPPAISSASFNEGAVFTPADRVPLFFPHRNLSLHFLSDNRFLLRPLFSEGRSRWTPIPFLHGSGHRFFSASRVLRDGSDANLHVSLFPNKACGRSTASREPSFPVLFKDENGFSPSCFPYSFDFTL